MFQNKFRKDFSKRRKNWQRKAIKSLMKNAGMFYWSKTNTPEFFF